MIIYVILLATLLAGIRWPGALLAGTLFTYQAEALAMNEWIGPIYVGMAAIISVSHALRYGAGFRVTVLDLATLALVCGAALSASYAPEFKSSLNDVVLLTISFGGMYAIARLMPPNIDRVLKETVIITAILGAVFSALMITNRATEVQYSLRLYLSGNTGASVVGMSQPFPIALMCCFLLIYMGRGKAITSLAIVSGSITLYASLLSSTRGVFLALAGGALVFLLLSFRHSKLGRLSRLACFAAAGIGLVSLFAPADQLSASFGWLTRNITPDGIWLSDVSSQSRIQSYRLALDLFYDSPIIGQGYGGYSQLTGEPYPHNMFLEFASQMGLLGLALLSVWLLALTTTVLQIYRVRPSAGATLAALCFTAFVQMQLSFAFYMGRPLMLFAALAAGSLAALSHQHFFSQSVLDQRTRTAVLPRARRMRSSARDTPNPQERSA